MLDEAVLGHKRQGILKVSLIFVLVFFIGNMLSSVIQSVPLTIYSFSAIFSSEEYHTLIGQLESGSISLEEYTELATSLITSIMTSLPFWVTLITLFSTALIIVTSIVYCVKFEKRPITSMGVRKKDIAKEYLIGMGIGTGMFALSYLFAYLCGAVTISVNSYISPFIILFFLGFVIQGASEEFLVRGYYISCKRYYNSCCNWSFLYLLWLTSYCKCRLYLYCLYKYCFDGHFPWNLRFQAW